MTSAARRPRLRASSSGDAGFSLVETVVAMTVSALVFGAVGGVLVTGLKATLVGRQAQQAADLANRTVEQLRNRDYSTLGMASADIGSDAAITASGYAVRLSNGTTTMEPVVLVTSSPIAQHVTTTTLDNTAYTVARYVTSPPADPITGAAYRRVTVVVSWANGSRTRSRSTSTLVGLARRGLPAPASDLRVTAPPTAVRGGTLTVRVAVTNLGVRSRWTIQSKTTLGSSTTDLAWPVTWYLDDGMTGSCNGVRDEETPAQVGTADIGMVASGATGCLIGQYAVPNASGTFTVGVTATVITATGIGQTQSPTQCPAPPGKQCSTQTRAAQVTVP